MKNTFGKVSHWIASKEKQTGWGNPGDMLEYIKLSKDLNNRGPKYTQTLTYFIVDETNSSSDPQSKKNIKMKMDPCLALHGILSLKVLGRYIELFSNKQLTIAIKPVRILKTATRLDQKNYIVMGSLTPWDEDLSL